MEDWSDWNQILRDKSYFGGAFLTEDDFTKFATIKESGKSVTQTEFPNLFRWHTHMRQINKCPSYHTEFHKLGDHTILPRVFPQESRDKVYFGINPDNKSESKKSKKSKKTKSKTTEDERNGEEQSDDWVTGSEEGSSILDTSEAPSSVQTDGDDDLDSNNEEVKEDSSKRKQGFLIETDSDVSKQVLLTSLLSVSSTLKGVLWAQEVVTSTGSRGQLQYMVDANISSSKITDSMILKEINELVGIERVKVVDTKEGEKTEEIDAGDDIKKN